LAGIAKHKLTPNMKQYLGTKSILATPMILGDYNAKRGWTPPEGENQAAEGYLVEYLDGGNANHADHVGYISWSPKDVFERSYRQTDGLTFGHAIEALKLGKRVARSGWNGKGMYLWLLPAATVKAEWCREAHLKAMAEAKGGEIECLGSIRMMTADQKVLTGWLASQTDILSEDWQVIE
jgi:hypothetical protein